MTTVAVLGDSVMAGQTDAGNFPATAPCAVMASALGWTLSNWAVGATGYLRDSTPGVTDDHFQSTFAAQVPPAAPDIVWVCGSSNDLPGYGGAGWTAAEIAAEAASLFAAIKAALPGASIVATAPLYQVPSIDASLYTGWIAAVQPVAKAAGAAWIDPIAGGWINDGNRATYLASDGIHPKDAAAQTHLGNLMAFGRVPVYPRLGSVTTGTLATAASRPGWIVLGAGQSSTHAPGTVPPVVSGNRSERPSGRATTPTPRVKP
jgi:lysophospholipase L1-like esterase